MPPACLPVPGPQDTEDGDDEEIITEYVSAPVDLEALVASGAAGGEGEADGEGAATRGLGAGPAADEEEDPDRPMGLGLGFGGLGFTRAEVGRGCVGWGAGGRTRMAGGGVVGGAFWLM